MLQDTTLEGLVQRERIWMQIDKSRRLMTNQTDFRRLYSSGARRSSYSSTQLVGSLTPILIGIH